MTERLYKKYVNEDIDELGRLKGISFNVPENFNFGFDVVDVLAEKSPDKTALLWLSSNKEERRFSFKDISELSNRTANFFVRNGIKKGDRVMVVLKRGYQFWLTIVALHKVGAVAIPATHLLTKKDFAYRFGAARVTGIVCVPDDGVYLEAQKAEQEYGVLPFKAITKGVKAEGWLDFDEEIMNESPIFPRPTGENATKVKDYMLMYFTSGTVGYPKIAAHTFDYPLGHITTAVWWHNVDPKGIHFTVADTGWGKAVWGKLYGQWLAETCIFAYDFDRFHAEDILPLFKKYNITTFCAPPTIYRFFIKEDLSAYDLSSLSYATTAGEALNPEVFKQFYNATGLKIMEGFGQTETTLTIANLRNTVSKPGSMGLPNPQYDVRLVDAEGNETVDGVAGEIVIRVDKGIPVGLFSEYYMNEKATTNAWRDGFYHTGDVAWRDEDGYLWFFGRNDDVIKSSGYRIGPFEIESVIMEHPSVLECAVTGVPDPLRGAVVKATIVLIKGVEPSEELKKEIQEYVKKQTAPYKYPRVIEFVTALPKTISGKIRRVDIRK